MSAEALGARGLVEQGAELYRFGTTTVSEMAEGQFWALQHHLSPGFARSLGIPASNVKAADFIMMGVLRRGSPFITRQAPGVGRHVGGAMEVVVPPGGVRSTGAFISPPGW